MVPFSGKNILRWTILQTLAPVGLVIFMLCGPGFCRESGPPGRNAVREMSLADCVFLSVRKNRDIESAYLDRVVQKFDLKVAEDEFAPNVDVTASVGHAATGDGKNRSYTNSADVSTAVTEKIPTGAEFTFTWANAATRTVDGPPDGSYTSGWDVSVRQPLLKGGGVAATTAALKTSRINEQINVLSLKTTLSDIITSAIKAYRTFVQARRQLEINRRSVQRARDLLDVNRALIAAGRMARVEIVQTQADIASKEFTLTEAENAVDAARLALLKVLDIDTRTRVEPVEKMAVRPVRPDLAHCQVVALRNRRDYLQSLLNLRTSELALIVARNNRLWDLSLKGGYGIEGESHDRFRDAYGKSTHAGRNAWNVGLTVSIPLYGDLTREQGVVSAGIALKKARIQLKELEENIKIEVVDAVRDVEMKLRQVELARQARGLSEKKLEIEKEKLKAGRSSNFQLVSFQNDLLSSQNSELNATISYLNALTTLDDVLGTTLDTWKIKIRED